MRIRNRNINFIISYLFLNIFVLKAESSSLNDNQKNISNKSLKNIVYENNIYNPSISRLINSNKRNLNELNKKCNKIDYINELCIECNIKDGYYPIYHDYNYDNRKFLLKKYINNSTDCYNQSNIPIGYYFNNNLKAYEKCYYLCKKCYGNGNRIYHNCSSCINNYIFQPEIIINI